MSLSSPLQPSLLRSVKRTLSQIRNRNLDNYPYLSGDCFARAADYWAFGRKGDETFDISRASQSRSVFVSSHRVEEYLELAERSGVLPDVLLSGNSDHNFFNPIHLPEGVKVWLSQNNVSDGERTFALPIGLENITWAKSGLPKWFDNRHQNAKKLSKIFVPPMSDTNPTRLAGKKVAEKRREIFDVFDKYVQPAEYFRLSASYKFVLCLEGNGFDTHRVWETLYQDSFPVLVEGQFSNSLRYLGLPILEIPNLETVTHDQIAEFYRAHEAFSSLKTPQLWMPFWERVIADGGFSGAGLSPSP